MYRRFFLTGLFLLSTILLSNSCVKEQEEEEKIASSSGIDTKGGEYFPHPGLDTLILDEPIFIGDPVLGHRLVNPYSMAIMQRASDSLRIRRNLAPLPLTPTHLYVRYLPQDSTEYRLLESAGYDLFDTPLDYDLVGEGTSYHDPSLAEDQMTWQYCSVPYDSLLTSVAYEVLDTCYIPQWEISLDEPVLMSVHPGSGDNSFERELEELACTMANPGNGLLEIPQGDELNSTSSHPSGYIKVRVNGVNEPVKRVKVKTWYFVKVASTYTDENGHYRIPKSYSRDPRYKVKFVNKQGFEIYGSLLEFSPLSKWSQHHSKNGWNKTYTDSTDKMWRAALINNCVYDYYKECAATGITPPPSDLHISVVSTDGYSGGAPMLHKIGSGFQIPLTLGDYIALLCKGQTVLSNIFMNCLKYFAPDIVIADTDSWNIRRTVYHELSHASHYRVAGKNFWVNYILYIVSIGTSSLKETVYGDGISVYGGMSHCELGEAWAYARERLFQEKHSHEPNAGSGQWFDHAIEALYDLMNKGILTDSQILSCMSPSVTSIDELCQNLCETYPGLSQKVMGIFVDAAALTNQSGWYIINDTGGTLELDMHENGIFWKSLTTEDETIPFVCAPFADGFRLDTLHPAFFPDSLLMVVNGRTLYQSYNGVITSSLSRPFFMPSEWYAESSHFEEGGKTVNKYYYTLSNTDYE